MLIRRSGPQPDTKKTPTGGTKMVTRIKRTLGMVSACSLLLVRKIQLTH